MKKYSLLTKIVFFGTLWGFAVLVLSVVMEPTPENFTLIVAIFLSGVYTWLLYLSKEIWLPGLSKSPIINAVILGSLNAAVIETLFLFVEKAFGAEGVSAHPNLFFDLLMTMPWYIGMVWIFVKVQKREQFSPAAVLLFGALYELGADGFIGGLIAPTFMGESANLINTLVLLLTVAFWQFIPVYSSLVLPPTWILEAAQPGLTTDKPRWQRGFLPLLWLIPFTIYLIIFIFAMSSLGA